MQRMSWISGVAVLILAAVASVPFASAADNAIVRPKEVPETDLDLYLARHQITIGPKEAVVPLDLKDIPGYRPVTPADLPDFMAEVERKTTKKGKVNASGLLATINYMEFPERKIEGDREIKLKLSPELTGFKEEMEVRTFWQAGKAPLAVTLLGFSQAASDHNARAYQADLFNAGCHVLSFDSLIRVNMNRATGHGVFGNVMSEGNLCAQIIDSVLKSADPKTGVPLREKITSVRLVGFSYGGNLLLQTLRDPRAKQWPVDRALVVSTPVNFVNTSRLFDLYHWADQTHFSTMSLAKLLKGYTPKGEELTPREQSLMRAGLGYSFHGDVALMFADNMKRYMPQLMDELKAFSEAPETVAHRKQELERVTAHFVAAMAELEQKKGQMGEDAYKEQKRFVEERYTALKGFAGSRLDDVRQWTFRHGRFLLVRPFWDAKKDYSDYGRLAELMKGAPNFVQAVIAADDPLNLPEDVADLKQTIKEPHLIVIPHGGHLGMSGTKWFQTLMAKVFAAK